MTKPEPPLDDRLATCIEEFAEEHSEHWSNHPEVSSEWLDLAAGLAEALLESAERMDRLDKVLYERGGKPVMQIEFVSDRGVADFFENFPEAEERIQILLARRFCRDTKRMAERCLELSTLALNANPQRKAVTSYLQRLSRCYIAGLLPECVMLCRSVLENALEEAYARSSAMRPESEQGTTTFYQDLNAAFRIHHWLSEEAYAAANKVRLRGNHAVHNAPDSSGAVLETIRLTMESVEELYSAIDE